MWKRKMCYEKPFFYLEKEMDPSKQQELENL